MQMLKRLPVIVVALSVLSGGLLALPAHGQSELAATFRDWSAQCAAAGSCNATTEVRASRPAGTSTELRIIRPAPQAPQRIRIGPLDRPFAPATELRLRVDRGGWITLTPAAGYTQAAPSAPVEIIDNAVIARLLPSMRAGANLFVEYDDADGERVRLRFSLLGLTASLEFIAATQPRLQASAAAEPTPVAETPPAAAPTPVAEAPPAAEPEPAPADAGAASALDSAEPVRFICQGNEPFWNLTVRDQGAVLTQLTSNGEQAKELAGTFKEPTEADLTSLLWRGRGDGMTADLVAFIDAERCLDTMAGEELAHQIRLSVPPGKVLNGCCRVVTPLQQAATRSPAAAPLPPPTLPQPAAETAPASVAPSTTAAQPPADPSTFPVADLPSKSADDWSHSLLQLLPAIEICLRQAQGPNPRITRAWPLNQSMVGVRLRDGAGGWWDCITQGYGANARVALFDAVPADEEPLPGESEVIFTSAEQLPPAGGCYRHERVLDDDGTTLGWLSYDIC